MRILSTFCIAAAILAPYTVLCMDNLESHKGNTNFRGYTDAQVSDIVLKLAKVSQLIKNMVEDSDSNDAIINIPFSVYSGNTDFIELFVSIFIDQPDTTAAKLGELTVDQYTSVTAIAFYLDSPSAFQQLVEVFKKFNMTRQSEIVNNLFKDSKSGNLLATYLPVMFGKPPGNTYSLSETFSITFPDSSDELSAWPMELLVDAISENKIKVFATGKAVAPFLALIKESNVPNPRGLAIVKLVTDFVPSDFRSLDTIREIKAIAGNRLARICPVQFSGKDGFDYYAGELAEVANEHQLSVSIKENFVSPCLTIPILYDFMLTVKHIKSFEVTNFHNLTVDESEGILEALSEKTTIEKVSFDHNYAFGFADIPKLLKNNKATLNNVSIAWYFPATLPQVPADNNVLEPAPEGPKTLEEARAKYLADIQSIYILVSEFSMKHPILNFEYYSMVPGEKLEGLLNGARDNEGLGACSSAMEISIKVDGQCVVDEKFANELLALSGVKKINLDIGRPFIVNNAIKPLSGLKNISSFKFSNGIISDDDAAHIAKAIYSWDVVRDISVKLDGIGNPLMQLKIITAILQKGFLEEISLSRVNGHKIDLNELCNLISSMKNVSSFTLEISGITPYQMNDIVNAVRGVKSLKTVSLLGYSIFKWPVPDLNGVTPDVVEDNLKTWVVNDIEMLSGFHAA